MCSNTVILYAFVSYCTAYCCLGSLAVPDEWLPFLVQKGWPAVGSTLHSCLSWCGEVQSEVTQHIDASLAHIWENESHSSW